MYETNNNRLPDRWRHGQFGWREDFEVIGALLTKQCYCCETSWLLYCIVGHLNPASAPSILLILLEPHSTNKAYGYKTLLNTWCFYAHTTEIGNRISINIVYIHVHTLCDIQTHICTNIQTLYIHTHKHIHTKTYTHVYRCIHMYTHTYTRTHPYPEHIIG